MIHTLAPTPAELPHQATQQPSQNYVTRQPASKPCRARRSPCLKLKPMSKGDKPGFQMLAVETYGGGLWHTWFDRDLSVAGRVLLRHGERLVHRLARPLPTWPALHATLLVFYRSLTPHCARVLPCRAGLRAASEAVLIHTFSYIHTCESRTRLKVMHPVLTDGLHVAALPLPLHMHDTAVTMVICFLCAKCLMTWVDGRCGQLRFRPCCARPSKPGFVRQAGMRPSVQCLQTRPCMSGHDRSSGMCQIYSAANFCRLPCI